MLTLEPTRNYSFLMIDMIFPVVSKCFQRSIHSTLQLRLWFFVSSKDLISTSCIQLKCLPSFSDLTIWVKLIDVEFLHLHKHILLLGNNYLDSLFIGIYLCKTWNSNQFQIQDQITHGYKKIIIKHNYKEIVH